MAWWNAPDTAQARTFWQFSIEPSPTFSPSIGTHARYNAVAASELVPVLDGRSFAADNEGVRECLTETGIILSAEPMSRAYVRLHGNEWIGPVRLIQRGRAWFIDPQLTEEPLRVFEMTNPDGIARFDFQGTRLFPGPNSRSTRFLHLLDWAPDTVVLRRVLRRLREFDSEYAAQLQLTAAAADRIVERLAIGSSAPEAQLDMQRLRRVQRFLPRLGERSDLVAEIVEQLLGSEAVKPELERRQSQLLAEYRAEASETIARETQAARQELTGLTAENDALAKQISRVRGELADLEARLDRRVSDFETELRERLKELAANPERFFADLVAIRDVFSAHSAPTSAPPVVIRGPAIAETAEVDSARAKGEQDLLVRDLRQRFSRAGFPPSLADGLHATLLAGAVPLLVGGRSFAALSVYASRVAERRLFWTPISVDITKPSDLLGRARSTASGLEPVAASLLDFLVLASTREDLHLVVLDAVNVAAMETYLLPVLALYTDAQTGNVARTLRFEAREGTPIDLAWPGNVLLAGVCQDGVATMPLPRSAWIDVVLLDLESFEAARPADADLHPDDRDAIISRWPTGSVSLGLWRALKRSCHEQDITGGLALWGEAREKFRLPSDSKDQVVRLFAAARLSASRELISGLAARAMLPYVLSDLETFVTWLIERNFIPAPQARLLGNVRRLLG